MSTERLAAVELAAVVVGTLVLVAVSFRSFPRLPSSQVDLIQVVGEGATAVAFLVVIASVYRFRGSLETEVYHPFVLGFTVLYFSALLDFVDEFVAVSNLFTYTIENAGGVLGVVGLVVAFGYWVNQYEKRGQLLTKQEEQLQQRNEQLEVLTRIVRHDIRNDLNLVQGRLKMASDLVAPEAREHLERADKSVADAVNLTDTARAFVEALNEGSERELEPIPLGQTVRAQVERTRQSYPDADIRFDQQPDPDTHVLADDMISSLFRNLLVNAVQHNDKSVAWVTVSVEADDETVVVAVTDNGPGIPDESKDRVFGRGESGLESPGTGIGLYLVDELVSQYGGAVWIEDNEPEGTIFKVRLQTT